MTRRRTILELLGAALGAVDPRAAVARAIGRDGRTVVVGGERYRPKGRIVLLALGKAAVPMAEGASAALTGLPVAGVVAGPEPAHVAGLRSVAGDHPVPGPGSLAAGLALVEAARAAAPDDLVLALVSGGGSSLAEVPAAGLTAHQIEDLTDRLLRSGAPIGEINLVRRHLSAIKHGGLAAASRAPVATLVLSDVPGDRPADVASGPTLADASNGIDALAALEDRGIPVPATVAAHLRRSTGSRRHPEGPAVVVGSGAIAAEAAAAEARRQGIAAAVVSTDLTGEAREVGRRLATTAPPGVAIHAGETTVTVAGPGRGGRNQELALAAGIALSGGPDVLVASMGTDGIDGPTDAAGAFGDNETVERGRRCGLDAVASLERNDSHAYLAATGDLIVTGPTGTNVADIVITWSTEEEATP